MLKETITFEDFNGTERTQECYFHFSKTQLTAMEVSAKGGLSTQLTEIVKSKDKAQMFTTFKDIILDAYGVKSEDGLRFIKTKELRDEFEQSPAFDTLFIQICEDPDKAAAFVNGIMPNLSTK